MTVAERLLGVLGRLTENPRLRVGAIDALVAGERERVYARQGAAPCATHAAALIERRAAESPDALAVSADSAELTYRELDTWANRLAHALVRRGTGPESVVGLALPRCVELAVAVLALLKSGTAFVLTGPDGSASEETDQVLTREDVREFSSSNGWPANDLDLTDEDRVTALDPRHLAWLQRPARGGGPLVALGHQALARAALRFADRAGLSGGTRLLAASPHDDAMLFEVVAALCAGAAVRMPEDLASMGGRWGWTGDVISTSGPFFAQVVNRSADVFHTGTVVLSGDTPPGAWTRRLRQTVPGVRVISAHGPAETARAAAFGSVRGTQPATAPALDSPSGGPVLRVLDHALRPVPTGVTGELYIGGDTGELLARGYHGNGRATAGRFVADPFGPYGSRMYRTGDLARQTGDGAVEYAGPADGQRWVGGRRVVPGDAAAVLAGHGGVCQAAALVREDEGKASLVAFVEPLRGSEVQADEIRDFAAKHLPEHLVPDAVVMVGELPLGPDGTVDIEALRDVGAKAVRRRARNPKEQEICDLIADVLGVDEVGIDDNIFALGCNSLKATRIIGRLRRTLGVDVSVRLLFQYPRVAELSGRLKPAAPGGRSGPGKGLARSVRDIRREREEQVTSKRAETKEQVKLLTKELVEEVHEQWSGDALRARVADKIDERIQKSMRRTRRWSGATPTKAGDGKGSPG